MPSPVRRGSAWRRCLRRAFALAIAVLLAAAACSRRATQAPVVWRFDNLESIGGHEVTVAGDPRVIDTPKGKALEFDGVDDGIFLEVHPIEGMERFTAEVVFRPYPDGPEEQRFLHMQQNGSTERLMFETRLTKDGRWFLDTFIKTGEDRHTLYAEEFEHGFGPWFHAAVVVDGRTFRHYVNGKLELATEIDYRAQGPGKTSLGVRQNRVYWFKGAVRVARFTPRPLPPEEFLVP